MRRPTFQTLSKAAVVAALVLTGCRDPSELPKHPEQAQMVQSIEQDIQGLILELSQYKEIRSYDDIAEVSRIGRDLLQRTARLGDKNEIVQMATLYANLDLFTTSLSHFQTHLERSDFSHSSLLQLFVEAEPLLRYASIVNEHSDHLPKGADVKALAIADKRLQALAKQLRASEGWKQLTNNQRYIIDQALLQTFNTIEKLTR